MTFTRGESDDGARAALQLTRTEDLLGDGEVAELRIGSVDVSLRISDGIG